MEKILEILNGNDKEMKKSLFLFNRKSSKQEILLKFNLWARHFFPQYFSSADAEFHEEIDITNIEVYRGYLESFTDIAFRGAAKTARTKLFKAFAIANDTDHFRKYIKVLSADGDNSKQIVTDIYNMLIQPEVFVLYQEIFQETLSKREETMKSFTTATGIKIVAGTVGTDQRGAIQEASRPDLIWFEDFENRTTLRSAKKTKAIWDNMEEARTGLSVGGSCIYTCNYVSEMGNVHKLVEKRNSKNEVLIIPIEKDGASTWPSRYSLEDIESMRNKDEDFEGERMCKPSANKDIYFDRERLDEMPERLPKKDIAGFKIYRDYDPSHRYGGGGDVAGGVGLDSSASVFIDFSTIPAQVVGTYHSNTINPEAFGDEMYNEGNMFGGCILAPENNKYDQAVLKIKLLGGKLYASSSSAISVNDSKPRTYGWNTNSLTKSNMMADLRKAIQDGLLELNDQELIREAKNYTRNDLIDRDPDPRLATRHFDLLTACAIAWQMKNEAEAASKPTKQITPETFFKNKMKKKAITNKQFKMTGY